MTRSRRPALPEIDSDRCTGCTSCAKCVVACPFDVITMVRRV